MFSYLFECYDDYGTIHIRVEAHTIFQANDLVMAELGRKGYAMAIKLVGWRRV